MTKNIIIGLIIFVLLGVVIGYFIYKYKTKVKGDSCSENDISNYDINETPEQGSILSQTIKENFVLNPGTITNVSLLDPNTMYIKKILNTGVSNTITPQQYNGKTCPEYPTEIYVPVSSSNTVQCIRLVRIGLDGNGQRGPISFTDIKIYDANGNIIPSLVASVRDTNGNIINSDNAFPASNITDNNMSTVSTIGSDMGYLQLTLPSRVLISRIVLTNRKDDFKNFARNIQVQTFPSIPSQGTIPSTTFNITDTRDTYSITYSSSSQPTISPPQSPVQTIASQGYKYVDGIPYYFLRLNNTGDIECLSVDGINCIETADETELKKLLNTFMVFDNKPVVCGPSLMDIEGTIGYDIPEHRCNMAMKVLNPTSPKLACEPYIYGSPEPVSKDCFRQLWANAGCGGDPFVMPGLEDEVTSGLIYESVKQVANNYAYQAKVLKDPYYMEYCL